MPFGPYYNALPVGGNGKRYVDQASWNAIVDNFVNWKGDVNAGGHKLSNVVMEFTDLAVAGKLTVGGNVGIGGIAAAAPVSRLSLGDHIHSEVQRIAVYETNGGHYFRGIGFCRINGGAGGFGLGFWSVPVASIPTHDNPTMVLHDNGYLGVGVNIPPQRLSVWNGNIALSGITGDYHYLFAPESGNQFLSLFYRAASDYPKLRYHFTGRLMIPALNTAPTDTDIGNSEVTIWYDQNNNRLAFRCKTSAGTLKTGYVNVT